VRSRGKFALAITNDKALASYAPSVEVVTENRQVTLNGPVRSDDERGAIAAQAVAIAGESQVTSELDSKPKNELSQSTANL
jgi:osmotically-inducible protein OsmY